jgi:hypothetical protein
MLLLNPNSGFSDFGSTICEQTRTRENMQRKERRKGTDMQDVEIKNTDKEEIE